MKDAAAGSEVRVVVVAEEGDLHSLEAEWDGLLEDSGATVFQSYEWISTWWKYFGGRGSLHCVCFRRGERLLGIAPLYLEQVEVLGLRVATRLRFIGRELADYGDLIIRRGHEADVVGGFVAYLRGGGLRWDVCDLEEVNESSELVRRLPSLLRRDAIGLSTYQGSVCPQRRLPCTWDEFVQSLGPNLRRSLRRKQERLEEKFDVRLEVFDGRSSGLEDAVNSLAAIHGNRWRSLGFPSAFDDARHRGFHLEVARRFASRGWVRLSFISVNGLRIAVSFDFFFRHRIYMYQCSAAGPEEVMRFSPGTLIKAATIRAGIAAGMEVYDFLRGDEAYKLSEWKAPGSRNYLLRLVNHGREGRVRRLLFFAWDLVQKSAGRVVREYYGLRRFTITQKPSIREQAGYVVGRMTVLLRLGTGYVRRNITARSENAGGEVGDGPEEGDGGTASKTVVRDGDE